MSVANPASFVLETPRQDGSARLFSACAISLAAVAAALAGWAPLGFSIVTVFLFAGPHNWIEFRYFLSQMPARWGPLRRYFLLAIGGVIGLAALFMTWPHLGRAYAWTGEQWLTASALWNSLLVLWVTMLAAMRARQVPGRTWPWVVPVGLTVVAIVSLAPVAWDLALVYLHPLVALWFLDRTLQRRRPHWRRAYHRCLLVIPVLLGALWWKLADAPTLPGQDMLTMRITRHAGADVLHDVSPQLLVATHTFLEMLHYGAWIVAIPLVGLRTAPWRLDSVPLFRRSRGWARAVIALLAAGGVAILVLWASFLANYPVTRDVYFTVAILHVLAEVPFLLRTF